MISSEINISPAEHITRLEKINKALMGRVERSLDFQGGAFSLFQTAILLEDKVRARTRDLEETLANLSEAYSHIAEARDDAEMAKQNLTAAIEAVSEGFALFDNDEKLVMCNAQFRSVMPDAAESLLPGVFFNAIASAFSLSNHLVLDDSISRAHWREQRIDVFRKPHASFIQQFSGDRWLQISNRKMASGATVIFQTDITDTVRSERVKHERELDEQAKLLRATIDHLPQGICMFSKNLQLKTWNKSLVELLPLPMNLLAGQITLGRIFRILSSAGFEMDDVARHALEDWLMTPAQIEISGIEMQRSDGAFLSVDSNAMPDGGIVVTFTDVTAERKARQDLRVANETLEQRVDERTLALTREIEERRQIERELLAAKELAEEANKGKTRYLAAASHDLLQPLNASRIFLSLLLESDLPTRQARLAESADKAFGSVEQLLEALLDISRYETRSVETNVTTIDLSQLFDVLQAEFQHVAERKNLKLKMLSSGISVRSDLALLRRIIQNLLSNALRYTARGGVLVAARRQGGRVAIEVYDTGPGIDLDKQKLVFEEFRRLAVAHESDGKGMGLGLAIVDRIAKLLGHEINLVSWPLRGSRFSVLLDEAVPVAGIRPARRKTVSPRSPMRPRCAVLIENDLQILAGMVELLETRNIKVVPAVSAEEALDALDTMDAIPDIVIADYHLDEGTGVDAIGALRRKCGRHIPAVIVTANHTATLKSDLAEHGVALLWKPIKPQQLFETIETAV